MKVEISDATYQQIAAVEPDVSRFVERAARQTLKVCPPPLVGTPEERGQRLVEGFREFRGMLRGATVEELADSRHAGL